MAQEDQDVNTEDSSATETAEELPGIEVESDADPLRVEKEDETVISDESEEDADEKEEDSDTSDESKTKNESEEGDTLEAKIKKIEEERDNLKIALRQAREKAPTLTQSIASVPKDEKLTIDPNEYVRSLVFQAEQEAKNDLYKEFPELHPDNDSDNSLYNEFSKDFAYYAKTHSIVPVTKEHFLQIGRAVMAYKTGRQPRMSVEQAKAEAHKETAKGKAADIGGSSITTKKESKKSASEADIRAARAAGMPLDRYLKNKDFYDDGTPI